jgi:hypothetical protein
MTPNVPRNGAKPTPGIRVAAEYRWAHPDAPWSEIAAAAGCHRNTLERWRDTEGWEIARREAGAQYASGAIEVLRALGFLRPPVPEVDVRQTGERDLDAEIMRLLGDVRPDAPT